MVVDCSVDVAWACATDKIRSILAAWRTPAASVALLACWVAGWLAIYSVYPPSVRGLQSLTSQLIQSTTKRLRQINESNYPYSDLLMVWKW